jgi:hypothetical protein
LKSLLSGGLPLTSSRGVNNLFLRLREWRSKLRGPGAPELSIRPAPEKEVVILAGRLDEQGRARAFRRARRLGGAARVQILGFGPTESGLNLCDFPGFHQVLARALVRIRGRRLEALTADLPGLGLGLLANYHFGLPLDWSGAGGGAGAAGEDFTDPTSAAWIKLLGEMAAGVSGKEPGVLEPARKFAAWYADFYHRTRSGT